MPPIERPYIPHKHRAQSKRFAICTQRGFKGNKRLFYTDHEYTALIWAAIGFEVYDFMIGAPVTARFRNKLGDGGLS